MSAFVLCEGTEVVHVESERVVEGGLHGELREVGRMLVSGGFEGEHVCLVGRLRGE